MTWVVPLALGGLAILLMVVFTMLGARKRQKLATQPAKVAGPTILVHDINDDRCTGCDACVAVCPTNVLDLVANKSRVLRFHDCIQCEACMVACPTEALVMFPEGATPPALKVPEIDDNFQTAVPGQYLIGEVAGKPLVKSAANLGRAVVEHMVSTGLRGGALGRGDNLVDVAIIGSGPGGLSAGLSCIEKKLSYVVLEKEQDIASTILRYPKGKLVMAEPYDTQNLSFLPVFDSSKEQLIPIWRELIERVGLVIKQGESVEAVVRQGDGTFEIRTTVATYRAQRVVLSIGTRGKPRTLQVPGENLPKVFSLLEDPDEWQGKNVLVVGGGDSACEAALALADAGARVTISYRGKGFNRAAPKNKQTIEQYAAEGRIKAKLGSQVLQFEADSVAMALGDGSQKKYPNDAAFVLIGADPPIAWLEKVGIRFVERPHQYQLGKTDDIVRKFVARAAACPEDAPAATAQILGGSTGKQPAKFYPVVTPNPFLKGSELPMPMGEPVSGPRKWLRSATSIFSTKGGTNPGVPLNARANVPAAGGGRKKLDGPVPLSQFAKSQSGRSTERAPSGFGPNVGSAIHHTHTGHGRRDQLTAGERTRILRMLRDEGGRLADEDSQVYIGAVPPSGQTFDFDFDDSPAPAPLPRANNAPIPRPDVNAKPAQIVGLAAAQAKSRRDKRTNAPSPKPVHQAPEHLEPEDFALPVAAREVPRPPVPPAPPSRQRPAVQPPRAPEAPRSKGKTRPPPRPLAFNDEPTRQVNDDILASLANADFGQAQTPVRGAVAAKVPPAIVEEPTRLANLDARALMNRGNSDFDHSMTIPERGPNTSGAQTAPIVPTTPTLQRQRAGLPPPSRAGELPDIVDPHEEATRMANIESVSRTPKKAPPPAKPKPAPGKPSINEESTRAVDIRGDRAMSEVDWDLDE